MDAATLASLKTAFEQAPSQTLAKVILVNSLDLPFDELRLYFGQFDGKQAEATSPAADIFDAAELERLFSYLLAADQSELARSMGHQPQPPQATVLVEKPKLRVVEKNNPEPIADLNRYRQKTTNFSDVMGLSKIKKLIHKKIILPFQKPSLFQRFRKKIGGGVLLYGPPGCGKTLLARATAGECNASFYNIEISDVLDMYIGESEQKLHAIFERARNDTPCVLFFDELEALAGKRDHNRGNSANIISQFLTELDGYQQNNEGVLVLASTNVPWSIDPAFLRPGRFDRLFFVPPPDREARTHILEYYLKDRPKNDDINLAAIAQKTSGYSGADLENLIDSAADEAIDETLATERETNISFTHIKTALEETRATTTEWLTTARNYARYANDGGRYDDVLEFLKNHGK